MGLFDKLKETAEMGAGTLKDKGSELIEKGTTMAEQGIATTKEKASADNIVDKGVDLTARGAEATAKGLGSVLGKGLELAQKGDSLYASFSEKAKAKAEDMRAANAAKAGPVYEAAFEVTLGPWTQNEASERQFSLEGEEMVIPEKLDRYVGFRRKYIEYADACIPVERLEYESAIHNFSELDKYFPLIYQVGQQAIAERTLEALLANGVYNVTAEAIAKAHRRSYHKATDMASAYMKAILNPDPSSSLSAITLNYTSGLMPQYRQFFSTGSALRDIQRQNRINVKNAVSAGVATGLKAAATMAAMPKPEELAELYESLDVDLIFALAQDDYANMSLILAGMLNENGGPETWTPPRSADGVAATLENIANPSFPKSQLPKVFADMLLLNPYSIQVQDAFIETMDETDEVKAIREYFGF